MGDRTQTTVLIRLLGTVEVAGSGIVAGSKQPLILALLAAEPGWVVTIDAITDVLWPDGPPSDPERSIQVHVSNLRRTLTLAGVEAAVVHRGAGYALDITPGAVDVHRFEALVTDGVASLGEDAARAREVLVEALELWRGRPLGGLGDHLSLQGLITRLEHLRSRAIEARIDADLALGHHADVVDELRTLTVQLPLREPLWVRLMTALYVCGREAEALEAYARARVILREELGTDPSGALQDLHDRMLRRDPTLVPPAPGSEAGTDPSAAAGSSGELVALHAVEPPGPPTGDPHVAGLVAEARQQHELRTEDGFGQAIALYRAALDLDPTYVDAWVGLADALTLMDSYGHGDRHELLPAAERAAHRALALEPDSARARTSLGMLHTVYQDGPAALRELDRAIRVQDGYALAHDIRCWVALLTGDAQSGLDSALRTVELDPASPEPRGHLALAYAAMGDAGAGLVAARRAGSLSPYTTAALYEGLCLHELGDHRTAAVVLEPLTVAAGRGPGVPWAGRGPDALLALALVAMGDVAGARRVLAGIDPVNDPFAAGTVQLGLGEVDGASRCFADVGRMTAWPCLLLHHYLRPLWATIEGTATHRALLATAARSWQLGSDDRDGEGNRLPAR